MSVPANTSLKTPTVEKARPSAFNHAHLRSVTESIVFAADKPVSLRRLTHMTGSDAVQLQAVLDELHTHYRGRGIELVQVAAGYQFRTPVINAPFVRDAIGQKPVRLSRAQLEVLAIVAYRQPVTRPEIDDVRGVDSGAALKVLAERDLLRILGRKEEPGRPLLYGTTAFFLEFFGLKHLRDLPTLREFSELSEDSKMLFHKRLGEPFDVHAAAATTAAATTTSMGADDTPRKAPLQSDIREVLRPNPANNDG